MIKKWILNIFKEYIFFLIHAYCGLINRFFCLFPIKNNRIYVNYFDGKSYGDNPKYIIQEVLQLDPNAEVLWLNKDKKAVSPVAQVRYVKPYSIMALFYQATSHIWISAVRMPYYSKKRQGQIYYQTWHAGLNMKKVEKACETALSSRYIRTAKHDSTMIDYYISENDHNSSVFTNYFWYQGGTILKTGAPRNDVFFYDAERIKTIKEKLKMNESKKYVMYAPTFRKSRDFTAYTIDFNRLRNVLSAKFGGDWIILVRFHPILAYKSNQFIQYDENIINASNIGDIQEVLLNVDALITDYSSISADYQFSGKPVFLYASDIEEYKKDRDFLVTLGDLPFTLSTNNNDLMKAINEFDSAIYLQGLIKFREKYNYYNDGHASEYIAKLIHRQLQNGVLTQ